MNRQPPRRKSTRRALRAGITIGTNTMRQRLSRSALRAFGTASLLLATPLVASTAWGNGRFPRAQRLVESATDPKLLALYGTYGLIVSSDSGGTWNHVCEAATGTYTGED